MARPTWKDINFNPVSLPSGTGARRSAFSEPLNNVDAALGRFREVIGDYDRIQREQTNAELAKRMMGYTDPNELRSAIASGSLAQGLDPRRVSAEAYSNANNQIGNLLASAAADLSNRTGEFNLGKDKYGFERLQNINSVLDSFTPEQQEMIRLGTLGDIAGQGNIVSNLTLPEGTPHEALNMFRQPITDTGLPTAKLNEDIRSANMRDARTRQTQALQAARLAFDRQEFNAKQQALAYEDASNQAALSAAQQIAGLPESLQGSALRDLQKNNADQFMRVAQFFGQEATGNMLGSRGRSNSRGGDATLGVSKANTEKGDEDTVLVPGGIPTSNTQELDVLGKELLATKSNMLDAFTKVNTQASQGEMAETLKSALPGASDNSIRQALDFVESKTKGSSLTSAEKLQVAYESYRNPDMTGSLVEQLMYNSGDRVFDSKLATQALNSALTKANRVNDAKASEVKTQYSNAVKVDQKLQKASAKLQQQVADFNQYYEESPEEDLVFNPMAQSLASNIMKQQERVSKLEEESTRLTRQAKESLNKHLGNVKTKKEVPQGKLVSRDLIPDFNQQRKDRKQADRRIEIESRMPSNINPKDMTKAELMRYFPEEFPTNMSPSEVNEKVLELARILLRR